MDHINNYFFNTGNNLKKSNQEKEIIIDTILKLTKIQLNKNELSVKKQIVHLHVFGVKRTKILENKEKIKEFLLTNFELQVLGLK